jgi:hypothetical protein
MTSALNYKTIKEFELEIINMQPDLTQCPGLQQVQ